MKNETIIVAILILLFIINIISLFLISKSKNNKDYDALLKRQKDFDVKLDRFGSVQSKTIADEFSRSRMENAQSMHAQRQELTAALSEMSGKIEASTKDTYSFNMKAVETISKALKKSNEAILKVSSKSDIPLMKSFPILSQSDLIPLFRL